jgi:hypothetical protein
VIHLLKLISAVESSSSMIITLGAQPRLLEVALKLSLYVVSLGKFVLPIFVIVSSSRSVFMTTWVRKGLRETQLFVSSSTRT